MKKMILLACIAFTLSAQAQQKPVQPKADTAKPIQKYFLIGTLDNYRLLFSAVSTPGDVTPNQQKLLMDWINAGLTELKTDTLPKKK